jgi:hypothetical protein
MVNNWYACEELTRQHQAELEGEAAREVAREAAALAAHRSGTTAGIRSALVGLMAGLHGARRATVRTGRDGPTRPSRVPRAHLPHRHVHVAR